MKPLKNKAFLSLLIFVFSYGLTNSPLWCTTNNSDKKNELSCLLPGEIRIIYNQNIKSENKDFCINHSLFDIISFNCLQKNNDCFAIKNYKNAVTTDFTNKEATTQNTNPFHKRCSIVGGTPQLISYFDKNQKKWIPSALCYFNDNSFISVFNLL